jgi:hypothetical protein
MLIKKTKSMRLAEWEKLLNAPGVVLKFYLKPLIIKLRELSLNPMDA